MTDPAQIRDEPPGGAGVGATGQAHARVAQLLDAVGDLYFTLDRDWRFTYLNSHALRRARRAADELLGRVIWDVYPELVGTPLEGHYRHALATGETVRFEMSGLLTGDWFEVYACPSPEGLTVYSRDVTERRRAEDALRESERRLRAITTLTSDYTYICRVEPDGLSVLESASDGFVAVTGYTVEELEARGGWAALVHPDDLAAAHRLSADTAAGRPWTGELRIVTRGGETRWVRTSGWPVREPMRRQVVSLLGAAQDITERKWAELALRESEERHRILAELTSDYTYTCRVEPDGRAVIESASPGFRAVTGYTVEELEARGGWAALIHPDDMAHMLRLGEDTAVGRTWTTELRIVTRRGETRWVRSSAWPVLDGAGRLARLLGAGQDITERKRADLALRASEELNRRILESVPAGVATVGLDGSLLQANEQAQHILGLSDDALARLRVSDFAGSTVREDGSPCPVEDYPVSKCLRTALPQPPEILGVRRPDGEVVWAVFAAAPLFDPESGRPCGAVVTFVDITPRKHAEHALRESEERLRRFFEAAFEGLVLHEDGVIRDANEAFARMYGYEPHEVLGRPVVEFAAPAERERLRHNLRAGREQPYEGFALRKDGTTFPVELCGKNVRSGGRTLRVTALRDITERRRAEEQLRHYAEQLRTLSRRLLEVQEAERRHLARELHDEVGQQLTALQLAVKAAADRSPERRADGLARAQRLVGELMGQVRDLSQSLRPTLLDDLGLLPALLWHFRRYTAQTGVRVQFDHQGLNGRLPPAVETAAYRIVQEALTNVARHAGAAEAAVTVRADARALRLRVEDRGAGFDAAADGGNGLSGMRERAALLGGRLQVKSVPGAGTRLSAELPLGISSRENGDANADAFVGR